MCDIMEKFMAESREKGREEGREEGTERMAKLVDILLFNGRIDDLNKIGKDATLRKSLFEEYNL
ncbi:MAG: hypothetical protein K2N85_07405 [Lachnospiraceae bacterium]|nr:hypothetical protein [Lachnospiraceae bacterium]